MGLDNMLKNLNFLVKPKNLFLYTALLSGLGCSLFKSDGSSSSPTLPPTTPPTPDTTTTTSYDTIRTFKENNITYTFANPTKTDGSALIMYDNLFRDVNGNNFKVNPQEKIDSVFLNLVNKITQMNSDGKLSSIDTTEAFTYLDTIMGQIKDFNGVVRANGSVISPTNIVNISNLGGQNLEATLYDEKGIEVAKTTYGIDLNDAPNQTHTAQNSYFGSNPDSVKATIENVSIFSPSSKTLTYYPHSDTKGRQSK